MQCQKRDSDWKHQAPAVHFFSEICYWVLLWKRMNCVLYDCLFTNYRLTTKTIQENSTIRYLRQKLWYYLVVWLSEQVLRRFLHRSHQNFDSLTLLLPFYVISMSFLFLRTQTMQRAMAEVVRFWIIGFIGNDSAAEFLRRILLQCQLVNRWM